MDTTVGSSQVLANESFWVGVDINSRNNTLLYHTCDASYDTHLLISSFSYRIHYDVIVNLKECGLTTLETRRLRGDQIEVFKILNGYENIDRNMFFSLKKDSRTRGHEVKLVKDQCRLDIRKHLFSQRTINEWNKLSTDCVTASSVNMFKNKVDTYLRRAGYK